MNKDIEEWLNAGRVALRISIKLSHIPLKIKLINAAYTSRHL